MKCEECRWFNETEGNGYCHRYPPTPITWNADVHDDCWSSVELNDFCGEFQSKKNSLAVDLAKFGKPVENSVPPV